MESRDRKSDRARPRPAVRKPQSRPQSRSSEAAPAKRGGREAPPATPTRAPGPPPAPKAIELPDTMLVRDLARALHVTPIDIIKVLMANGILVGINEMIDYDTAEIVAGELGFETRPIKVEVMEKIDVDRPPKTLRDRLLEAESPQTLEPRPPVVTVLGHVDHGKTTLLDAIRQTNVVASEHGGITQHIGAYQVEKDGQKITFLDTPGHEAFTAMRARGAQVTDLAVLVVAAEDGVMPQTREAIDHARAANVPILVALNKMDLAGARPERVKQQLADLGLTVEDWGGDVVLVPVSARQRHGIEELLENILLVTGVADLRSNPNRPAVGTVVEGQLDRHRGPTATLLVQAGTLRVGDALLIGTISGRVRAMMNDRGEPLEEAAPSTPVLVMGLSDVPKAGDIFEVVENERKARVIAQERAEQERLAGIQPSRPKTLTLSELFSRFQAGEVTELNLILKADVQGSLEPIVNSLERLSMEDLKIKLLHQGTGDISESDVMLASASHAIIIGFHVDVDEAARRLATQDGVDIRQYMIIYQLIDDVDKALKGLLEPVYEKVVSGHAEVRAVFHIRRRGNVAGCYVTDGEATRSSRVRVLRGGEEMFEGRLDSLRRFQEDVSEVRAGFECGIGIANFEGIQEGDVLEFYTERRVS